MTLCNEGRGYDFMQYYILLPRYEGGGIVVILAEIPDYFICQCLHVLCLFP